MLRLIDLLNLILFLIKMFLVLSHLVVIRQKLNLSDFRIKGYILTFTD